MPDSTENLLFLRPAERTQFEALPAELRAGCAVEDETIEFQDTPEKMQIRVRNMLLTDPQLLALKDRVASATTQEDFGKVVETVDFDTVDQDDLIELYFALGPDMLTAFIGEALRAAATADDITALVALATLRHGLLISLTSTHAA